MYTLKYSYANLVIMTLGLDIIYDGTEPINSELQLRPGNEVIACVGEDKARFNSAPFTPLR